MNNEPIESEESWQAAEAMHPMTNETVSQTPKLKSCPFCGSKNIDAEGWRNSEGITGPACDDCGASAGDISHNSEANIVAWNTRANEVEAASEAQPLEREDEMLCFYCGCTSVATTGDHYCLKHQFKVEAQREEEPHEVVTDCNQLDQVERPELPAHTELLKYPEDVVERLTASLLSAQSRIGELEREQVFLKESLEMRKRCYAERDQKESERANAARRVHEQRQEIVRLEAERDQLKRETQLLQRVVEKISYKYAIYNHHDEGEKRGAIFADKFIAQEREGKLDSAIADSLKNEGKKYESLHLLKSRILIITNDTKWFDSPCARKVREVIESK